MNKVEENVSLKANILIEALPYIKKFQNKKFIIKIGGSTLEQFKYIIEDIALLHFVGFSPIVVHGGGELITNLSKKLGKESKFFKGYRITDEEDARIVEMVLSGFVNKEIVSMLNCSFAKAIGISGADANLLVAEKFEIKEENQDLGFVGEIKKVNNEIIESLIELGHIVVISPVARDKEGKIYNINADSASAKIATSIKAEKIVYLTDVNGVLKKGKVVPKLNIKEAKKLIKSGEIKSGMIPKVNGCIEALEGGVKSAHIINGNVKHSLLMEIFTMRGIGTMIE